MEPQFEAVGDLASWPKNEPSKPTQSAVLGVYHPKKGKCFEILWTGQFPDLQPAIYWAAKKEVEAVRKGKWMMATRVVWQHDLTPEQAVAAVRKHMEPQVDRALRSLHGGGGGFDIGPGPMRPVGPDDPVPRYVEIAPADDPDETLDAFIMEPPKPPPPEGDKPG